MYLRSIAGVFPQPRNPPALCPSIVVGSPETVLSWQDSSHHELPHGHAEAVRTAGHSLTCGLPTSPTRTLTAAASFHPGPTVPPPWEAHLPSTSGLHHPGDLRLQACWSVVRLKAMPTASLSRRAWAGHALNVLNRVPWAARPSPAPTPAPPRGP